MFGMSHFQRHLMKKNHLVHFVTANALKPTHTLTILEPISNFGVPENVCLSLFQVLLLPVLLSCFHTHFCLILPVFVITLLPLSSISPVFVIALLPLDLIPALYGRARGDFSKERLPFVCRCEEQFCFSIFF